MIRIDDVILNTIVRVGKTSEQNIFYDINLEVDTSVPHVNDASRRLSHVSTSNNNNNVSQTNTEVNTFDKNNSENPSTKFSNENMNDGKADNRTNNNNDVKYSTKNADELIENAEKASAFNDGNRIVPVQLEIKNYSDRANKLYLTVTLDKNQRNSDVSTSLGQNQLHNGITVPSDISISDLVKAVNPSNGKFLKYFPDSMLNSEQIIAKQETLKADEERINQYRNGEKQKHSNKFENTIDEILQDDDIKAKKNAENGKIVVISKKTPEVILKNVSDSQDLPLIMKYLKLQRSFEKGKK